MPSQRWKSSLIDKQKPQTLVFGPGGQDASDQFSNGLVMGFRLLLW